MQVTETLSEGLKREFHVVLAAADLSTRLDSELNNLKTKARINGFRPGKVPLTYLKRLYGRSIMADVMQEALNEANRKIVEENDLRLAGAPQILDLPKDEEGLRHAFEQNADFTYKVALEILPKFEIGSFEDIAIERLAAEIPEEEIDSLVQRLAEQNRTYTPKEGADTAAAKGDKVTLDFLGKLGEEPFEGGSAEDADLVLGSGSFIPGFEEQIEGMKVGESRTISVTFPEAYTNEKLAGQLVTFDVTLKAIAAPAEITIDDAFAKGFGYEDLAKLREGARASYAEEQAKLSRRKWKRELLDALDKKYTFELPEALVSREFDQIWKGVEAEQTQSGRSFADEGTTEEAARADYQQIAERRVRLGLVLAEIGEKASVTVSEEEVRRELFNRVRNYPGMEKQLLEFYRKNPEALAEVRAPLFEEKVIDHLMTKVTVTEKQVSKEELLLAVEAGEKDESRASEAAA
ncbi:MAG: trigger factor [Beijerinckiaceae bacterium]